MRNYKLTAMKDDTGLHLQVSYPKYFLLKVSGSLIFKILELVVSTSLRVGYFIISKSFSCFVFLSVGLGYALR
jgi:hypothetical protein